MFQRLLRHALLLRLLRRSAEPGTCIPIVRLYRRPSVPAAPAVVAVDLCDIEGKLRRLEGLFGILGEGVVVVVGC